MQLLTHTTQDSALQVNLFPFTFGVYRTHRFWVETGTSHSQRAPKQRFMSCFWQDDLQSWSKPKERERATIILLFAHPEGHPQQGLPYTQTLNLNNDQSNPSHSHETITAFLNSATHTLTPHQIDQLTTFLGSAHSHTIPAPQHPRHPIKPHLVSSQPNPIPATTPAPTVPSFPRVMLPTDMPAPVVSLPSHISQPLPSPTHPSLQHAPPIVPNQHPDHSHHPRKDLAIKKHIFSVFLKSFTLGAYACETPQEYQALEAIKLASARPSAITFAQEQWDTTAMFWEHMFDPKGFQEDYTNRFGKPPFSGLMHRMAEAVKEVTGQTVDLSFLQ